MEQKKEKIKVKYGRKPKEEAEKSSKKVGGYWLTPKQSEIYYDLFKQSQHKTETDFFKHLIFDGKIKLYYSDSNTEKIYFKIIELNQEINQIGKNINQVTKRIGAVTDDKIIFESLNEMRKEIKKLESSYIELKEFFKEYSPSKIKES